MNKNTSTLFSRIRRKQGKSADGTWILVKGALLIILIVLVVCTIFDYLLTKPVKDKIASLRYKESGEVNMKETKKLPPIEYYNEEISRKQLFKSLTFNRDDLIPADLAAEQAIKNLNLRGIIKDKEYYAVIEDRRTKKIYSVYKGDFIDEIEIEDILESKAIFKYKGKIFEISL